MSQQSEQIDIARFLENTAWVGVTPEAMGADMGARRYFRLEKEGHKALLMDMSRSGFEEGLGAYIRVADYLRQGGVRVPEIYDHDIVSGLAVIEDFGTTSFGDAVKAGEDRAMLYGVASDVLRQIRQGCTQNILALPPYHKTGVRQRLTQFIDFYMPSVTDHRPTEEIHAAFQNVWAEIEKNLAPCPKTLCHADYHLENVMWRPDTPEKYGLIDFQDAFWGPQPYDLLNLLEDARQTVPPEIKTAIKERYCQGMSAEELAVFNDWYTVLSAHFHCRVIGLFVKFPYEGGRDEFLGHIPRLQGYIKEHLKNPALAPLKIWVEEMGIPFDAPPDLSRLDQRAA